MAGRKLTLIQVLSILGGFFAGLAIGDIINHGFLQGTRTWLPLVTGIVGSVILANPILRFFCSLEYHGFVSTLMSFVVVFVIGNSVGACLFPTQANTIAIICGFVGGTVGWMIDRILFRKIWQRSGDKSKHSERKSQTDSSDR
jgi:hypothetical protein